MEVNHDEASEKYCIYGRSRDTIVELSYIAQINIEIAETATRKRVWAGAISRIHQVTPGEDMHEERARPEFYKAFARVLENYPAKE